jgi:hypothetical protein
LVFISGSVGLVFQLKAVFEPSSRRTPPALQTLELFLGPHIRSGVLHEPSPEKKIGQPE